MICESSCYCARYGAKISASSRGVTVWCGALATEQACEQSFCGSLIGKQSCCLLAPPISIFSQVSYDYLLVGQAFMRCFKTRL